MSFDQDAVDAAAALLRPEINAVSARLDAFLLRLETLEKRPDVGLFAARDDFETALFSAMQGMTDGEQVAFLKDLTAQLSKQ